MNFNKHSAQEGQHAPFGASKSSWIRYDDDKLVTTYRNLKAAERGTRLHAFAAEAIALGITLKDNTRTINRYVNDALGFRMSPEVVLFYSPHFFGTADAISFRNRTLRISDYKSGKTGHVEQLEVYAALFCLEYKVKPADITIILKLYKEDQVETEEPDPQVIVSIMEKIKHFDSILNKVDDEEEI